ncbi:transposase [Ruegeria sp. HKCCD8929]|uniref:IS110 family transposase n=1 Tax=Ruegeria sp. HKCCD8929 TaxID=2683006 RepID=UPI0020C4D884|nr:transposase [Ruegeria sp. HKCCD8929]
MNSGQKRDKIKGSFVKGLWHKIFQQYRRHRRLRQKLTFLPHDFWQGVFVRLPRTGLADPEGVADWFSNRSLSPSRIVHESGQLSIWLQRGLVRLDLPATCIDARKAHKALSARLNKSDMADAEGLAQLARTGWFTPVHVRSEEADRLRSLVGARERLIRLRKDLEGHIRGVLKTFGIA